MKLLAGLDAIVRNATPDLINQLFSNALSGIVRILKT